MNKACKRTILFVFICLILFSPLAGANSSSQVNNTISVSDHHYYAIDATGALWGWGSSNGYALGLGDLKDGGVPKARKIMTGVKAIASGQDCALALKTNGTLWTWGNRASNSAFGNWDAVPKPKQLMTDVTAISMSRYAAYAVKKDGSLYEWGTIYSDKAGAAYPEYSKTNKPKKVMADVKAVASATYHTLVLKMDGTVWSSGLNRGGQLGNGTLNIQKGFKQVMSGATAIAAGGALYTDSVSLALKSNGTLYGWGSNSLGQLGLGITTQNYYPAPKKLMTNVRGMTSNGFTTFVIDGDGQLYSAGDNSNGLLGHGISYTKDYRNNTVFTKVLSSEKFVSVEISGGVNAALALTSDGRVFAWGEYNDYLLRQEGLKSGSNKPVEKTSLSKTKLP